MTQAQLDLARFTEFAQRTLSAPDSDLTLEECVRLWRQESEREALIADLRQGKADYEAGLAQPLVEAFDDIRRQLGIRQ